MKTNDPALTKTPINNKDHNRDDEEFEVNTIVDYEGVRSPRNRVVESDTFDSDNINRDDIKHNTSVNKGTETFDDEVVHSEHVNDGDNSARQPDRRDQEGGTPFDENINEDTVGSEAPQSREINDMNRYADINNAQTRTLTPDEED